MEKSASKSLLLPICAMLVLLAEIASLSTSLFMWHEPDCPEELIK